MGKKRELRKDVLAEESTHLNENGGKTRSLFAGEDSDEGGDDNLTLKVNSGYAAGYDKEKERKEKESLMAKDLFDDDSSEGTEEDEDGGLLDEEREFNILAAVADIKEGKKEAAAKRIEKVNADVAAHLDTILKGKTAFKDKKFTMKEYMREQVLGKDAETIANLERDEERKFDRSFAPATHVEKAQMKEAFLSAAADAEDGFVIQKAKSEPAPAFEPEDPDTADHGAHTSTGAVAGKELERRMNNKLASLFKGVDPSDENETFLKNFFLQHAWQEGSREVTHHDVEDVIGQVEAEEDFQEKQLAFEENYEKTKYHHQEEEADVIPSYPRSHKIEDSLRKTDNTRKAARERKKQREAEATVKRDEEVKRLKALQRKDMNSKLSELQDIAGKKAEELFNLADLDEDFDPDQWDKKMEQLFNEDYYEEDDDFADLLQKPKPVDSDSDGSVSSFSDDSSSSSDEAPQRKKKAAAPAKEKAPAPAQPAPSKEELRELEKRKKHLLQSKEEKIEQQMRAYAKLDYEDVVGGQKVRFKYKSVAPDSLGLTDKEVLTYDDRTLNNVAPLKFYAPYRSNMDNQRDRYIVSQNKAFLPSLENYVPPSKKSNKFRTGLEPVYVEYKEPEVAATPADGDSAKKSKKKKKKSDPGNEEVSPVQLEGAPGAESGEPVKKKKKKKKQSDTPQTEAGVSAGVRAEVKDGKKQKRQRPEEPASAETVEPIAKKAKKTKKKKEAES